MVVFELKYNEDEKEYALYIRTVSTDYVVVLKDTDLVNLFDEIQEDAIEAGAFV